MFNSVVQGWINYYGRFYRTGLYPLLSRNNEYLVRWAQRKFKRLHRRDPEALQKSVSTVARAWGHDAPANDGRLIEGIGLVFARYGAAIEVADLVPRLASFGGGPGALLGKAKGLSQMIGCQQAQAVAEIVVETYNRARRTRALQPWRTSTR